MYFRIEFQDFKLMQYHVRCQKQMKTSNIPHDVYLTSDDKCQKPCQVAQGKLLFKMHCASTVLLSQGSMEKLYYWLLLAMLL